MSQALRALLVEDSADDAALVVRALKEGGYEAAWERVETANAMRAALARQTWDIVLSDYRLPQFSGPAALELLRASGLDLPFIVISGTIGEDVAVETIKLGATDYLLKDRLGRLGGAVAHALMEHRLRRERAAMLAAQKLAESRYRGIFEHAREGILQSTPDGALLAANPALARIFGYESAGDFMRAVPDVTSLYADPAQRTELKRRLEESGAVVDFEVTMRHRDGHVIWVSHDIQLVRDEHGVPHYEGTAEDVSARKRAEAVVQEAASHHVHHRRIKARIELALIGGLAALIYGLAAPFNWFESSSAWILATRGPEQMDKLVVTSIFLVVALFVFALRRWRESESESTSHRQVQQSLRLLHDELDLRVKQRTAELHQSIAALRVEVQERTRAEAAVRLQSAALTAAANAIIITDRAGTITWVNPAFTSLTGYTLAEAAGKNPRDLVRSGQGDRDVYQNLWETILAGRVWTGELINRRKDGSLYHEEQTITPVRNAAGEITHFIAIKQDLTERRLTDRVIQESRRRFQAVFEQAAVGMVIADGKNGTIQIANRRFCEMVGYTGEELRQLSSRDLTHPDDRAVDAANMQQITAHILREFSCEKRYRRKDGTEVWAKAFVSALDPTDPTSTLMIGAFEDITERKAADKKLLLFRALIEHSNDGIEVIDPPTARFVDVNESTCRELGYTRAELATMTMFDVVPDLDHPGLEATNARLRAEGHLTLERQRRRKDGRTYPVEVSLSLVTSEREYVVAMVRNISERKTAERQLREQNEILSNSHEGVMIVNLDNQVSLWNRGAEALFGWTQAEALGRPPEQLLGTDELGAVATLRTAVERDGFWNGELRAQTRDGRKLTLDCRTTLVRDEAGRPRARLNFFADITEKKLLEEKFLHAQRLESVGMLAAGIAHDLNNVLAPIVFAAPMLRDSLSSARDLKILQTLEQSAQRGAGLVKQILGFAHSTTGEFRPTQVKHLARDIVGVIEETFPKSIHLEHQIPSALWPVSGNATQIHQVLMNLCVNARDAMPQGGTLRFTAANRRLDEDQARMIEGARPGAWLVLEISDTGSGIAPEVLEKIWTPFFTTKPAGKGTGLGLSTVRGLVAGHHGFVELHTELGRGTTFRVFLPAIEGELPRAGSASPFESPAGHNEVVLVVEDDSAIRDIVATILGKHGYRVASCADGVEAVTLFNAHAGEIALVITDVDMPRLGGLAVARAALQMRPDIRVIAMSGLSRNESNGSDLAAIRKLAHAFLTKPFKPDELLESVHRVLHPTVQP